MTPLHRKLLRDLKHIKGQAIAIGSVIALGVLMLVMMSGLVNSLEETRRAYYERYRLADVFAPVVRAPVHALEAVRSVPGVNRVAGRVVGDALIDLPAISVPIRARVVSLPEKGTPQLNNVYLTEGSWLNGRHSDQILILKGFARAHKLRPGDTLEANLNGNRRSFRIVGLVQSPEFLYATVPGEIISDDSRFGVFWMNRNALAAAMDMEGAMNEVLLSLQRNAAAQQVLDELDLLLKPYGALGAYTVDDHFSNRVVTEEISGLRETSKTVPPVFLAVAAFLLYIVISRMVQSEREEIGLMKAFGYTNLEVSSHYMKLVLTIAVGGALVGCLLGIFFGRAMADYYLQYFKFPFLVFQIEPASFVTGMLVSVIAASAGGLLVLRQVFRLTPAVAMSPPAPPDYSRTGRLSGVLNRWLDQPSRMVLRRLMRQPVRMLGATVGIAAGMALSSAMISIMLGFDDLMELTFSAIDRSDVSVTLTDSRANRVIYELQSIPGVIEVEPVRVVSAVFTQARNDYRGGIEGLVSLPRLYRAVDKSLQTVPVRGDGLVLGKGLADILEVTAGDTLTVDIREGRQPFLQLPVSGIAETLMGAQAYMELEALNRIMQEPNRITGAYMRIDSSQSEQIYQRLKNMPTVAAVSLKSDARRAMQKVMDEGAGATRYIMLLIAAIITFGIVYNSARIAQAERNRDIASLRVLGFTRAEAGFVLLGELAVVTLLALPLGTLLGYLLSYAIAEGFSTEIYQVPVSFEPSGYGAAALAVIGASVVSGLLVKRDIDHSDLVVALKTRE